MNHRDETFIALLRVQSGKTHAEAATSAFSTRPLVRKHGDRKRADRRRPRHDRLRGDS